MSNDVIQLLPDSVANQIAAGEVIQRPASVVKELVENSIDAGAHRVQIVIKDAGKTLIQIIDDGCGMTPTDARMAFERHATSKIRKAEDLFSLHTMGFRGEALPSVAAVSEIELRTMRREDEIGSRLIIKASAVESQQPDVCMAGTNIMVRNLFYNFVARRRFLKKDAIELSHIMREFERLALVNTGVEFSLTHNGVKLFDLPSGPLQTRIGALFGKTVERSLIPIETETTLVKISGFVCQPSAARQRNQLQYFFVNGRNMRHPMFRKAVLSCYSDLISGDAQPNFFINFDVSPDRIDVNVHPQKHEIKFEDEQMIWQVLTAAVKESLGKYNVGPAIDFDATDVPDIPPMVQGAVPHEHAPVDDTPDPDYNPFNVQNDGYDPGFGVQRLRSRASSMNVSNWEKLYDNFSNATAPSVPRIDGSRDFEVAKADTPVAPSLLTPPDEGERDTLFQLKNRWIVTSCKTGLMFIDQHRAHCRVLYERLLPGVGKTEAVSQKLIFSEYVEVDGPSHAVLSDARDMLAGMGFEVSNVDGTTWQIDAVPADIAKSDPRQTLMMIVANLLDCGDDPVERRCAAVAAAMANAAAVSANQPLTIQEMQSLINDLFRLPSPNYTAEGKLIVYILSAEKIATMFQNA